MPKLKCPCGYVHNLSPIPDDGYLMIKDSEYEALIEHEIRINDISGGKLPSNDHPRVKEYDESMSFVSNHTGRIYECPECDRLMVKKLNEDEYYVYKLENF